MTTYLDISNKLDVLENSIIDCQEDLNLLGNINIKIKSVKNLISNQNTILSEEELNEINLRLFKTEIEYKKLDKSKRTEELNNKKDIEESGLTYQRISEHKNQYSDLESENEFFGNENSRLNDILSKSIDTIESLNRQGKLIGNINNRLKSTLEKIGVSDSLVTSLEKRSFGDKSLFIFMIIFIILLLFLFKFFF